jgi:hypothetical protein
MIAKSFHKPIYNLVAGIVLSSSLVVLTSEIVRAGKQNFTVINQTSDAIVDLRVSRSNTDDWEEDVLGRDVLDSGKSTNINFNGFGNNECYFDIQAKFEDGQVVEERKVNLCETDSYTFTEK